MDSIAKWLSNIMFPQLVLNYFGWNRIYDIIDRVG